MPGEMEKLAEYVTKRRASKGLTIADLVERSGLSDSLWYQVEGAAKPSYRDTTLRKVAKGLGVPAARVFRLVGRPISDDDEESGSQDLADRVQVIEGRLSAVEAGLDAALRQLGVQQEPPEPETS